MIGDVTLKVTPEILLEKSEVVAVKVNAMKAKFEQSETAVSNSAYYWVGEAGDIFRRSYKEKHPQIEEVLNRMNEHVADLRQIAQNYMDADKEIQSVIAELPSDVIV